MRYYPRVSEKGNATAFRRKVNLIGDTMKLACLFQIVKCCQHGNLNHFSF